MTDETKPSNGNRVFFDKTPATIKLNDTDEPITIEAGSEYVDAGATVTDNIDGFISSNYQFTYANYYADPNSDKVTESRLTEIDTRKTGLYKIAYIYTDKAGNTKTTVRTVIVKDTTAPVITANGKSQTLKVGDTYTELGATLTDNAYIDADDYEITIHFYDENGKLVYPSPSNVDTSKVGEYRIAYTAKDSSGNASNVATISVRIER